MAIQLTVMSLDFDSAGKPTTQVFERTELTLGRDATNDIVLARPEVSGVHAKLRVEESGNGTEPSLYISDMGSFNGTMVESQTLEPHEEVEVFPDQRIIIGNYLIRTTYVEAGSEVVEEGESFPIDEQEGEDGEPWMASGSSTAKMERPSLDEEGDEESTFEDKSETWEEPSEEEPPEEDTQVVEQDYQQYASVRDILEQEEEVAASEESGVSEMQSDESVDDEAIYQPEAFEEAFPSDTEATQASDAAARVKVRVDGADLLDLDFSATELFTLGGTVRHNGEPLADVNISIGSACVTTGTDGVFSFPDIIDGTPWTLSVEREGYRFDCPQMSGEISGDVSLEILATRMLSLSGKVLHKDQPLAGVTVEDDSLGIFTTDSDGMFRIEELPEGTSYSLTASKERFRFECQSSSGTLTDADVEVEFSATQLFSVSGRIVHKGEPMAGVEVDGGPLGKTVTGPDGVYRFEDVPEGTECEIVVSKKGFLFG